MPSSGPLAIWMNDLRVGTWAQPRTGAPTFHYDPAWIASDAARVLSLSRPFMPGNTPHRGAVVTHFFENLLPDSAAIRRRLQARFATGSTEAFDLLTAIGRDCVGAVQLLPDDEKPTGFDEVKGTPLDESGVEQTINAAVSGARLLGQIDDSDFRLSLAGAQEKTALLFHRNRWDRPTGATPTTHIFKLPLGLVGNLQADLQDLVENAWLCSRLVAAFGLETRTPKSPNSAPAKFSLSNASTAPNNQAGSPGCRRRIFARQSACPDPQIRIGRRPGQPRHSARARFQLSRRRRQTRLRQGPDRVLAPRRDRRPREELLSLPRARRHLPHDPCLRGAFRVAHHRPGPQPTRLAKSVPRPGRPGHQRPFGNSKTSARAIGPPSRNKPASATPMP